LSCVLVVEDDPWIQWIIADDLADRDYNVKTAWDGIEALTQLAEVRPDVIVLDLMLPRSSGWDFVERCYQEDAGGDVVPIVVISAARDGAVSLAFPGVERFLPKPFDIEELAQAVDELSGRQVAAGVTG
jgi:CheY-like chemotaxis protein